MMTGVTRTTKVAALTLVAAVVALRVVPFAHARVAQKHELARARALTLAAAREMVAGEPATRESLQVALREFVALAPRLLDGRSQAEAGATLVSWISGAASGASLKVRRAESLADSGSGVLRRVRVRAELEGDVAGITMFLRDAEQGDPVLSIPMLAVTAVSPTEAGPAPEIIRVEIVLTGWYLGPAATP